MTVVTKAAPKAKKPSILKKPVIPGVRNIEYHRPPLTKYQLDAFFGDNRYSAIEATSKAGKSYAAIAFLWEQAALHGAPGRGYLWVAPSYAQTEIMYRRLKLALPQGLCK